MRLPEERWPPVADSRLSISYGSDAVKRITRFYIAFWNAGDKGLPKEGNLGDQPYRIELTEAEGRILESDNSPTIRSVTREVIAASVRVAKDDPTVLELGFDYLDSGDGMLVEFLWSGPTPRIKLVGANREAESAGWDRPNFLPLARRRSLRSYYDEFLIDKARPIAAALAVGIFLMVLLGAFGAPGFGLFVIAVTLLVVLLSPPSIWLGRTPAAKDARVPYLLRTLPDPEGPAVSLVSRVWKSLRSPGSSGAESPEGAPVLTPDEMASQDPLPVLEGEEQSPVSVRRSTRAQRKQ